MVSERLGLTRPRIGLQRLCSFGTKKGQLKKPRDFELARLYLVYKLMDLWWPCQVGLGYTPQGFQGSRKGFSLDPTGRLCSTFGTFGSLTNISGPSGH